MKKHYDFNNASRGELHRSLKSLRIPVYLDEEIQRALVGKGKLGSKDLSRIVNHVLRSQLKVAEMLK